MKAIQVTRKFPIFCGSVSSEIIGYFDNLSKAKEYIKNIPYRVKSFTVISYGGKPKKYISYTCKKVTVYNH
jgi:hypothetical protein